MPVMKKTILYSLFIVSSVNFSLHSQDLQLQDNEDLLLVFDGSAEEMYPLEDADTVCLMPEIQNYVDALELDPTALADLAIEVIYPESLVTPQSEPEIALEIQNDQIQADGESIALSLQNLLDAPEIMMAPENNENTAQQETLDFAVCQIDTPQAIACQPIVSIDDVRNPSIVESIAQLEQDSIQPISKDQLEALLQNQCEQCDLVEQYFVDLAPVQVSIDDNCATISLEDENIVLSPENGISFVSDSQNPELEVTEDDDIVPVPHDLINSVKKANKLKKKLEKKARKEKASFFKKSKKKN